VDGATGGLLGAVDIRAWNRSEGRRQTDRRRKFAEKESYRWLAGLETAAQRLSQARSLTAVMDAESDIYELFALIHWLLLTSHEVNEAARAIEIVDLYKSRWWIEQLFRTLKSAGFRIEDSELGDPQAFINFAGLATIAAVTVMQLVKARDGGSGQMIADCFEADDKPLLQALSKRLEGKTARQKNPHPPDDLAFASWVIARLGGWTGYYGKPGPEVMRHGLDRFHAIKLGAQVAKDV